MFDDFNATSFTSFERWVFVHWSRFIDMFTKRIVVTVAIVAQNRPAGSVCFTKVKWNSFLKNV
jgi:hypothetical protein